MRSNLIARSFSNSRWRDRARFPLHRDPQTLACHSRRFLLETVLSRETYDAFNRRVTTSVDADGNGSVDKRTFYAYDGANVIMDIVDADGDGSTYTPQLARRYFWGFAVDQLFAEEDVTATLGTPERVLWHLTDNLQSTRDLLLNDGTLYEHYAYDSFGNIDTSYYGWTVGAEPATRFLYTDREFDFDTGLQYNRNRWYDPVAGRWISEDPIGLIAGPNPYEYVSDSPTNYVDPTGLFGIGGHFWTTYLVAMATGKYSTQQAFELAYYSQYPDQDSLYEAISSLKAAGWGAVGGLLGGPFGAYNAYKSIQWSRQDYNWIHSLHGGDPAAVKARQECLTKLLRSGELGPWERGIVVHALGDSHAHVDVNGNAYGWPYGHGLEGHLPDLISQYPDKYIKYVNNLYTALGGVGDPSQNADLQTIISTAKGLPWKHLGLFDLEAQEEIETNEIRALSDLAKGQLFNYNFDYEPANDFNRIPDIFPDIARRDMERLIEKIKKCCGG